MPKRSATAELEFGRASSPPAALVLALGRQRNAINLPAAKAWSTPRARSLYRAN